MSDINAAAEWQNQSQPLEISSEKVWWLERDSSRMKIALLVFCASAAVAAAAAQAADALVDASSLQPVAEERSGYVAL